MENNAVIFIKTCLETDGDNDAIELETTGRFAFRGGKYYIVYDESPATGFSDTTTTIKAAPKNVTVMRHGKASMKMEYIEGERRLCMYPTPYGNIAVEVQTTKIDFDLNEGGGTLKVDYLLDRDNINFSKNSLCIKVRCD